MGGKPIKLLIRSFMKTCTSSGIKSSSGVISARPCAIHAVTVIDASAAATVIVYDNATTNAGTAVAQVNATVNASANTVMFSHPVECNNGAYAAVTGSGAGYIVHYSPL
jgi:hypothetical protein